MGSVTVDIALGVITSAAPVPPFAFGVTGPMLLQFMIAQVTVLDSQIQAMQSMRSSDLQFISFYFAQ